MTTKPPAPRHRRAKPKPAPVPQEIAQPDRDRLPAQPARVGPGRLRRLAVLHEDDDLLGLAKPADLAVHGGAGEVGPTVIDLVRTAYDGEVPVELVHRLDRATSGVLLLAKSRVAAERLRGAWERARKTYLAIVLGTWQGPALIDTPLTDQDGRLQTARTRVRLLGELAAIAPAASLVVIELETGRTHQIRRHLAGVGHPVLLDERFGDFAENKRFVRAVKEAAAARGLAPPSLSRKDLLLHALRLEVPHPRTGVAFRLTADVDARWRSLITIAGGVDTLVDAIWQVP